ncbi:hypothetical protein H072_6389 [Dactylellina haptotyla CBS 200.50]|uniref:F-box domain-containing protein n=1 Tax=Dactylellina haptotyla (strain CBS 200.50) TaxID=1284197 RepID=S8AFM2_DACHA|nr:hypothetical protein H072_6389 [Dactylellina haptotyla CBS 200.50]
MPFTALPIELQTQILAVTCPPWYRPTIRLVCKSWNLLLHNHIKARYRPPFIPPASTIKKIFGPAYNPPVPDTTDFLIHRAVCEFTGILRGHSPDGFNEWTTDATYLQPDDDPLIVADVHRLVKYANDPVFISSREFAQPLRYEVYLGWGNSDAKSLEEARSISANGRQFKMTYKKSALTWRNVMKVKDFVKIWFHWKVRQTRELNVCPVPGGRWVQMVGFWSPWYSDATLAQMERSWRIDVKLVYVESGEEEGLLLLGE